MDKLVLGALLRYFKLLELFGYLSYDKVNQLIILRFIRDFLSWFRGLISDTDIKYILKTLKCLTTNSCLIHVPSLHNIFVEYFEQTKKNEEDEEETIGLIIYYSDNALVIENYGKGISGKCLDLSYDIIEYDSGIMIVNS